MSDRWYVAQVLAGLEGTAKYHLDRAGLVAFSPSAVVDNRPARLFPGYIFVELAAADEAGIVNRTRGVHKLLPIHAREPLPLPEGFVEELRGRIAEREFDERQVEDFIYKFAPQEEVFAKTGPFRDQRGRFLRYRKGCGIVLGYLLGREVEIPIPLRELAPVHAKGVLGRNRGAPLASAA